MELVKELKEIGRTHFYRELAAELQDEKVIQVSEEWGRHKVVYRCESEKIIKIPDDYEGEFFLQIYR